MPTFFDLQSWNDRLTSKVRGPLVFALAFGFAFLVFAVPVHLRGQWNLPPTQGDAPDYDAIALALARGHGFANINADPEFLAPYRASATPEDYAYLETRPAKPNLTAYRPPLFPMLMAGLYKTVGRDFGHVRLMNCLFMAAACGIVAVLVFRMAGILPAGLFSLLFVVFDARSREYAREILTESLATFLVMLLAWMFIHLGERRTAGRALGVGLVAGTLVLARSAFVMWLPGFLLLVFFLAAAYEDKWTSRQRWRSVLLFVAGFFAVSGPWFIRNCLVLEAPMPTGTQGDIALGSAYSDEIFDKGGNWFPLPPEFFAAIPEDERGTGLEWERKSAQFSRAQAFKWIRENPERLPHLVFIKLHRFWRAKNQYDLVVLIVGALGLLVTLNRIETRVCLAFVLLTMAQVAATYEAYGRFQVPLSPMLGAWTALGFWIMLLCATSQWRTTSAWLRPIGDSTR